MREERLIWNPPYEALAQRHGSHDSLILIVSPFIGLEALMKLLQDGPLCPDLKVLVRWRADDVRTGVTDIEIYPYLAERKIPLYMNNDIHLKLYIFESNCALSTSANLTLRGFGYAQNSNVEVGQFVKLAEGDWLRLYRLFEQSRRVDSLIYTRLKAYKEQCADIVQPPFPELVLPSCSKAYSLSSLPSVETPSQLIDIYLSASGCSEDELRRFAHDITIFGIENNLERPELEAALRYAFRSSPFIKEFVEFLMREAELRFGSVASWIHNKCEDVPLPYRWEVKESTRVLYNWLAFFFEEIRWDTPNYSQVIYWTDKSSQVR